MKPPEAPPADDGILTVEELAAYLKVNSQTIYRRFRAGELPGVRIGRSIRFPKSVVDAWLRLRATGWTAERRGDLYEGMEGFAVREGIREADVLRAVKKRRKRG
jgi:excisionase family DNA binding protein